MKDSCIYHMVVCYDCGEPASHSISKERNGRITETWYYCKLHTVKSNPNGGYSP